MQCRLHEIINGLIGYNVDKKEVDWNKLKENVTTKKNEQKCGLKTLNTTNVL